MASQTRSGFQDSASLLFATLQDTCRRYRMASLYRQLEVCEGLVGKSPLIDVAILGQFKAGKSSFLNSFIGCDLLPVGVIPVTTAITRLQYGPRARAVVTFLDATSSEVPLEAIADYTSEARNPGNERNVELVDLEVPALEPYKGLRFVDTPGLGSVFKYHMETSEHWLPEVGAAILAVSSDRPLSEHDLFLIRELMNHTPRIVLMLTKADLLSVEQQEEVVRFFRTTLARETDRDFPIYLYSGKIDTDRYRKTLDEELFRKLSANRDREFRRILRHKLHSIGQSCLAYLDVALKASQRADKERREIRELILSEQLNYASLYEELIVITRENAGQTRTVIERHLQPLLHPLAKKLADSLADELPNWKGNLWKLTRRFEEWMREAMSTEMDGISRTEQKHFFGTLKKTHASLDRALEAFRAVLGRNVETVLGVTLAETEWTIEVAEPGRPDFEMGRVFDFHFDLLWFLFPMLIFRPLFERHFRNQIPRLVEINMSRLTTQWESCINKAMEDMRKQAARYIRDELATIESLLEGERGRSEEIRRTIDTLTAKMNEWNELQEERKTP
ncbi:MAG: Bacterial dynamin-like protein [Syntrophaceae bacterium PtaU1.Bin231]|nr:MAG: Bacterial dynamin-like protein [Syntrophaceae bacterium PtaU1.Bin231]